MRTFFAVLLLSAAATFVLTPWVRRLAFWTGAVDPPGGRRIHRAPIPRLGGLAVFGGFCLPWFALYLVDNRVAATFQNYETTFAALMLGATAMLLLGVFDDFKGARARTKLAAQTLVAGGLYWSGFKIEFLSNPAGEPIALGAWSGPVSILWIVGITNAMNLLDGIDGLVAGVTACIALTLAFINLSVGNVIVGLLTLSLAGACLGFLPYNFSPARIFLGDSGSLFLGTVLACAGTFSLFKGTTATLVLTPLILFGLPLYDTARVMWNRWRKGRPLFQADRTHIHHRLLALGLNPKQVVYFLYGVTVFLSASAVALHLSDRRRGWIAAAALSGLLAGGLAWRWRAGGKKRKATKP